MKKIIYDITPFTTTDYKDHLAAIVWFRGCNMRCLYCYNCDIVTSDDGKYSVEELLGFLKKRSGLLDAVVLSGGEATLHDLVFICKKIKELGFKIKLDTNGSQPKLLQTLLENSLVDIVALDFKGTQEKFKMITKTDFYNEFLTSLELLQNATIEYEIRTTLHYDLLDESDIISMQEVLIDQGYQGSFFLQSFLETKNFADLKVSNKVFDSSQLHKNLEIVFRD